MATETKSPTWTSTSPWSFLNSSMGTGLALQPGVDDDVVEVDAHDFGGDDLAGRACRCSSAILRTGRRRIPAARVRRFGVARQVSLAARLEAERPAMPQRVAATRQNRGLAGDPDGQQGSAGANLGLAVAWPGFSRNPAALPPAPARAPGRPIVDGRKVRVVSAQRIFGGLQRRVRGFVARVARARYPREGLSMLAKFL